MPVIYFPVMMMNARRKGFKFPLLCYSNGDEPVITWRADKAPSQEKRAPITDGCDSNETQRPVQNDGPREGGWTELLASGVGAGLESVRPAEIREGGHFSVKTP